MKKQQPKNRSERVRAKRQNGSKRSEPKRKRKQNEVGRGNPPVMVRGSRLESAAKSPKSKKKRIKRRYDVALPSPGVEVRLPALPSVKFGWRLLSFLLVLLLGTALYYVFNSPTYRIYDVQMDGLSRFSAETIGKSLLIFNKPIFTIEPEKLEERLVATFPGIVNASVRVGFPARVEVEIEEREPKIIWEQGTTTQWVDVHGISFPQRGEAENLVRVVATASPPAPIVLEGESTEEGVNALQALMFPETVELILTLSEHVPEGVPIVFNYPHGFGWHDPRGWIVYFGVHTASEEIEMKLAMYDAAVTRLTGEGISPAMISVEYLHAPYYRPEH